MSLLQVEHLDVSYGAIKSLHDVSMHINAGEIVTLIGANGAGKTTLLNTISGLLRPTAGTITYDTTGELTALPPHRIVRAGISHVPEGRQVFSHMSVRDNLLLGAYQRKDRKELRSDLDRYYHSFPVLRERQYQPAGTLSGGEQQMLAIARALMARPRLLLLDEPSLGLAPLVIREIFKIIQQINRDGTTVFLVEQNARMALGIAHRGYVMQSGHMIKSDTAPRLLNDADVQRAYLGG